MSGPHGHRLSAELIDGITEAVASPTDPRVRAEVIADLVHEVDEAVKWRNERHPGGEEEQSLAALVAAADIHRHRMDDVDEPDEDDEWDDDQLDEGKGADAMVVHVGTSSEATAGPGLTVSGQDFQALGPAAGRGPAKAEAPPLAF